MARTKKRSGTAHKTICRKVFYYKAKQIREGAPPFNCDQVKAAIVDIPKELLYHTLLDGDRVFVVDRSVDDSSVRLILGRHLIYDKPCLDDRGEFKPIVHEGHQRIAELTHVVLFPSGIVAAEFHHRGARISQFGAYLSEKCPALGMFSFRVIPDADTSARLQRLENVTVMRFTVHRSDIEFLDAGFGHMIRGMQDRFRGGRVDIKITREVLPGINKNKTERDLQSKLDEEFDQRTRKFIEDVLKNENGKEIAESIRINAREDRKSKQAIAILGDHLIRQELQIPIRQDGLPDSDFVFREIINLEENKRDELIRAATLNVD